MNETNKSYPRILPVGDAALTIEFGSVIDPTINQKVFALEETIHEHNLPGIIEMVPSYRSLLVLFDPYTAEFSTLRQHITEFFPLEEKHVAVHQRDIKIPVSYGGENGPDLDFVAEHNNLTPQQVIDIHTSRSYPVYMMGFTPGFPYLGEMDSRIAAPRLENPRTFVPAGSVGIAGEQTGVYSIDSPGGWRLIGKTNLALFNPDSPNPFLLSPGDRIQFVQVKEGEA